MKRGSWGKNEAGFDRKTGQTIYRATTVMLIRVCRYWATTNTLGVWSCGRFDFWGSIPIPVPIILNISRKNHILLRTFVATLD